MERLTEANERRESRSCGWMRQGERTHICLTDKTIQDQVESDLRVQGLGARGFVMQQARISKETGKEQKEATKVGAKIEPAELTREGLSGMGRMHLITNKP